MEFKAPIMSSADFHAKYGKPILLAAQPDTFRVLTDPDDLRKWEAMLAQSLGLKLDALNRIAETHLASYTSCESGNPSNDSDED
jgi:hypothetical protein